MVEGAAGAGKTTTLAATRDLLTQQGRRLVVVIPTLKAAKAAAEVGAQAGSVAWLAHQHGWRWTDTGTWTRLRVGDTDPVTGRAYPGPGERAGMRAGDLLVVDEAGMLDQDTARALLTVADECRVRVAFLGDRHQLAAVGRGGVLDLATRWADPDACATLNVVHRFTRQNGNDHGSTTVPDTDYAQLSTSMRTADRPAAVFDALHSRGRIRLHAGEIERRAAVAAIVAVEYGAGRPVAVVVDTREQVSELNAAIRGRLVTAGIVDDARVVMTGAGERIGVGDQVATRRNDRGLDVANRDTWTVTDTHRDGRLTVTSRTEGARILPVGYVSAYVELAYATTAHGAQGATVATAHLILGEHTGAAAAYVGMTRGRHANTAHLIATDPDEAREQWVTTFTRDRAHLGPDHARQEAERAAAHYATPRSLDELIVALRQDWDSEARDLEWLSRAVSRRDTLRQVAQLRRQQAAEIAPLQATYRQAHEAQITAKRLADNSKHVIAVETAQYRDAQLATWEAQRSAAHADARTVLDGPGRLRLKLLAVNRTNEALARWSVTWQPIIPTMPTGHANIARFADRSDDTPRIFSAVNDYARRHVEARHPKHESHVARAAAADHDDIQALGEMLGARDRHQRALSHYGNLGHVEDAVKQVTQIERQIATGEQRLTATRERITDLEGCIAAAGTASGRAASFRLESYQLGLPADPVLAARNHWLAQRDPGRHPARLRRTQGVAMAADSPRESQRQDPWRRQERGPASAAADQGVGR